MPIYRGQLKKEGLLNTPGPERTLFFALAHLHNEVNFLHRVLIWSSDFSSTNAAESQRTLSLSMFFLKLMAAKLKEGWQILNSYFFGARLSQDFEARALQRARDALARLKGVFSRANILDEVRTDFAFHYSPSEVDRALAATPDDLDLFLEDGSNINSLYYFAEVLANRAVLQRVDRADEARAMDSLIRQVGAVGLDFLIFCDGYMHLFIDRYATQIWKDKAKPVTFGALPRFREVRLPFFVDVSDA